MALSNVELTIERRESAAAWRPRRAARCRSVVILGKPTETNCALAAAFGEQGQRAWLVQATTTPRLGEGDAAVARLDVLPTLDGPPPSRRTRRAEATCSRSTARWTSIRPTPTTSSATWQRRCSNEPRSVVTRWTSDDWGGVRCYDAQTPR